MSFNSKVSTGGFSSSAFTSVGYAPFSSGRVPSGQTVAPVKLTSSRIVRSRAKRVLDIIIASMGLLITSFLFIPIAAAIKLNSPGPILFCQTRVGLHGRRFRIWKFRSMVVDAEALKHQVANQAKGCFFKNENDPRITTVGAFLRKTSLDEFPQFWNVLLGDMSAVGTRPPTVDEVAQYQPHHWQRLNVKPGITGEWQVKGRSKVRDFEDVVAMDLNYQRHWSVAYDLKLIVRTLVVVFNKEGAC